MELLTRETLGLLAEDLSLPITAYSRRTLRAAACGAVPISDAVNAVLLEWTKRHHPEYLKNQQQ